MPKAATSQKSKAAPQVNSNGGDSVENRLSRIEDSIIEIKTRLDYMPTHKDFAELIKTNSETMNKMHDSINEMNNKMHDSINGLRSEMNASINGLRSEMHDSINGLQNEMNKAIYKSALLTLGIISVVATVTGIIFGFVLS